MTRTVAMLSLVSALSLVACGGGGGGSSGGGAAKPGAVSASGAATVVMQTSSMQTALKSMDGSNLSGAVISVGLSGAQQIVQPGAQAGALTAVMSALQTPGPQGGTVDCTDTGCVYAQYKSGTTTLDGSIKSAVSGDTTTVTSNLTITSPAGAGQSADLTWKIVGAIDFTATTIDGDLKSTAHSVVSAGGMSFPYDYYNEVRYDALGLNAQGTAISGDIYAKWTITVGGLAAASMGYDGTAKFGN